MFPKTVGEVIKLLHTPFSSNGAFGEYDYDWSAWRFNPVCFPYTSFLLFSKFAQHFSSEYPCDADNAQLSSFDDESTPTEQSVFWINPDWNLCSVFVPRLLSIPALKCVLLVPVKDEPWSSLLEKTALYIAELPRDPNFFLPKRGGYSKSVGSYNGVVRMYFLNFEYKTGARLVLQENFQFPSVDFCASFNIPPTPTYSPPLPVVDFGLLRMKPKQPYKLEGWKKYSSCIRDRPLCQKLLLSLAGNGRWRTNVFGPRDKHLDCSDSSVDDVKEVADQFLKHRASGKMLGGGFWWNWT